MTYILLLITFVAAAEPAVTPEVLEERIEALSPRVRTEPEVVLPEVEQALADAEKLGDLRLMTEAQRLLASTHAGLGDQATTDQLLRELIPMCVELADLECEAKARNNLAGNLRRMGMFVEAIEQLHQAVALKRTLEHPTLPNSIRNLAGAYANVGDYDEALSLLEEAAGLSEEPAYKQPHDLDHTFAFVYGKAGRFEEALDHARLSLDEARQDGSRDREAFAQQTIGAALQELGRLEEAEAAHQEALAIREELAVAARLTLSHKALGSLYLAMERPDEALAHATRAIEFARESDTRSFELEALEVAHAAAFQLDRPGLAYEHLLAYHALQVEIFGEESSRELGRVEARAEAAEEVARLEHDQQLALQAQVARQLRLVILLLATVLVGFVGLVYLRLLRRKNQLIAAQRAEAVALAGLAQEAQSQLQGHNERLAAAMDELRTTQSRLVQAERLAAVGSLSAGVAHELNNPLNYISSSAATVQRLVEELDPTSSKLRELTATIGEGARRAAEIVQGLRSFSRVDRSSPEQADVHQLLDSTLALLTHRTSDRISVEREYGDLPPVECYPGKMNQVFMNLLVNAIDSIDQGDGQGRIAVRTRPEVRQDEPWIAIAVADDGEGIPPDVLPHLFEPFYTTKPVGEGTGLGLAISHGIVQEHGGDFVAENVPGGGACFTVSLPCRVTGTSQVRGEARS